MTQEQANQLQYIYDNVSTSSNKYVYKLSVSTTNESPTQGSIITLPSSGKSMITIKKVLVTGMYQGLLYINNNLYRLNQNTEYTNITQDISESEVCEIRVQVTQSKIELENIYIS